MVMPLAVTRWRKGLRRSKMTSFSYPFWIRRKKFAGTASCIVEPIRGLYVRCRHVNVWSCCGHRTAMLPALDILPLVAAVIVKVPCVQDFVQMRRRFGSHLGRRAYLRWLF